MKIQELYQKAVKYPSFLKELKDYQKEELREHCINILKENIDFAKFQISRHPESFFEDEGFPNLDEKGKIAVILKFTFPQKGKIVDNTLLLIKKLNTEKGNIEDPEPELRGVAKKNVMSKIERQNKHWQDLLEAVKKTLNGKSLKNFETRGGNINSQLSYNVYQKYKGTVDDPLPKSTLKKWLNDPSFRKKLESNLD